MNPHQHRETAVDKIVKTLQHFGILQERLRQHATAKERAAERFINSFLYRVQNVDRMFVESGSSLVYFAEQLNEALKRAENTRIQIETNNFLACLVFQMFGRNPVTLYPPGPPEEKYGATYGQLNRGFHPPAPTRQRPAVSRPTDFAGDMPDHFKRNYGNGLVFMSASGLEPDEGPFEGPSVGSYPNMLFKRILFETDSPIVMFLDQSKIGPGTFGENVCYPVCDPTLPWSEVCRARPFALAIGVEDKDTGAALEKMLLEMLGPGALSYGGRSTDTAPLGLVVANAAFEARFPLSG